MKQGVPFFHTMDQILQGAARHPGEENKGRHGCHSENEARGGSFRIMDQILQEGHPHQSSPTATSLALSMQISVARGDEEVMKKTLTPEEIQEVWKHM